jgi:hypothetical protein
MSRISIGSLLQVEQLLGFTGSRGDLGYTGSQGIGYTGSQGVTGTAGSNGYTGSQGDIGVTGYTGSQGIGFTGSKGDAGTSGSIGYTGSQGIIGYTGSSGTGGATQARTLTLVQPGAITAPYTGIARCYPIDNITISNVYASLGTASSINFSFRVNKNGSTVDTYTISANVNRLGPVAANISLLTTDYLTVDIVASSGATDLKVDLVY